MITRSYKVPTEPPPDFFTTMNDDCLLSIFSWLRPYKMGHLMNTCKTLRRVGRRHFNETIQPKGIFNIIFSNEDVNLKIGELGQYLMVRHFGQEITAVKFEYPSEYKVPKWKIDEFLGTLFKLCPDLKELIFHCRYKIQMTPELILNLAKLRKLSVRSERMPSANSFSDDLHTNLTRHFPNPEQIDWQLVEISIYEHRIMYNFFNLRFRQLKKLSCIMPIEGSLEDLERMEDFFENHSLTVLTVEFRMRSYYGGNANYWNDVLPCLNQLHKLNIYITMPDDVNIPQIGLADLRELRKLFLYIDGKSAMKSLLNQVSAGELESLKLTVHPENMETHEGFHRILKIVNTFDNLNRLKFLNTSQHDMFNEISPYHLIETIHHLKKIVKVGLHGHIGEEPNTNLNQFFVLRTELCQNESRNIAILIDDNKMNKQHHHSWNLAYPY